MKRCRSACAAWLALLLASTAFAAPEDSSPARGPTDPVELEAFFDAAIAAQRRNHRIVGAVVAVVRDGRLLFAKGYGYADLETRRRPDPERTLFRIASVSKTFTWTAIMQLAERDLIDLDVDVNTYLPDFQIPATFDEPITLAHLLTHTPGFEESGIGRFVREPEDLLPLGEFLAAHMPARVRRPGLFSSYSNYGASLAGYIVQSVSGKRWEEYIEEQVLEPLDMRYTTVRQPIPEHLREHLASSYSFRDGRYVKAPFWFGQSRPAGVISASAVDMAHFMIAHLQQGRYGDRRILSAETAARMQSVLFRHDERVSPFLHGFYRSDRNGQVVFGHGGDVNMFHSDLSLYPEHELGLFVSFNSDPASAARSELVRAFADYYFPVDLPERVDAAADFAARAAEYEGEYVPLRRNHSRVEKLALLLVALKVSVTDDGMLRLSSSSGEASRWVEAERDVFRALYGEERIVFHRGANGEVTHMFVSTAPTTALERLRWFESPGFHNSVFGLAGGIALVGILGWPIAAWARRRERRDRRLPRPAAATGWVLCGSILLFLTGLASGLNQPPGAFVFGMPAFVENLLRFAPVIALLTLGVAGFAVSAWARGQGSLPARLGYSAIALAGLLHLWSLAYWNALFPPYW